MKKHGRVINNHHISYKPEIIVPIFASEHQSLNKQKQISKKTVSKGYITCLKIFIALNEGRAVEL